MKTINIVLLAAGKASRFTAEGYTQDKCLLPVNNPFVQTSPELFHQSILGCLHSLFFALSCTPIPTRLILVTTSSNVADHFEYLRSSKEKNSYLKHEVVLLSQVLQGPLLSGMMAMSHIPRGEPILFVDTDNFYNPRVLPSIHAVYECLNTDEADQAFPLVSMLSSDDPYVGQYFQFPQVSDLGTSFVKPFKRACIGIYAFSDISLFTRLSMTYCTKYNPDEPKFAEMLSTYELMHSCIDPDCRSPAYILSKDWYRCGTPDQYKVHSRKVF